jgi:hypothetical protein
LLKGHLTGTEPVQVTVQDGGLIFIQKAAAEGALSS